MRSPLPPRHLEGDDRVAAEFHAAEEGHDRALAAAVAGEQLVQ